MLASQRSVRDRSRCAVASDKLFFGELDSGIGFARIFYFSWLKESGNSKITAPTGTRNINWFDFASRSNQTSPAVFSFGFRLPSLKERALISRAMPTSAP